MIFHSLDFAVFLALFLPIYWALPHRPQNAFLLFGSYFFYGYVHPWFLILLVGSTVADYSYALGMRRFEAHRRALITASIATNLGLLACFKYFDFFSTNVASLLHRFGLTVSPPLLRVALPVGISFYTFQSLSYTIDVYRKRLEPRRDFLEFATFLALFPQLVAGPIERAVHMLPQVSTPRRFDPERARLGAILISWGLFKKLVIADNVALVANKVFALEAPTFSLIWVGTLAFCIQIYADFSAYSDIARGTARLLGFELMQNFDHPYLADTPSDFWRRWHISLSTWFRDYVYVPLGGNRGTGLRVARNVMITFLLSGFWHGASWNFVLWGGYHGLLLIAYRGLHRLAPRVLEAPRLKPVRVMAMFVLVNVGWLMFRETNTSALLRDLVTSPLGETAAARSAAAHLLALTGLYSLPLLLDSALYLSNTYERVRTSRRAAWLGSIATATLIASMACFYSEASSDFIYFQF
ncbi:MAG TPA: MBOAT family O-acyltransferase [Polyangiaceae bacterium]|jgi:D-alanyl-lipoteichoic acid acyltransferase DltB (MBOAT superfamily)|nr:MBOAT family O-acyltransferase [Polyangiaceae bacterium]